MPGMNGHSYQTELTRRQREVLRMLERGHTNSEIADALGISLQGAKWHVRELLGKFGVDSREELIERRERERSVGSGFKRMRGLLAAPLPKLSGAAVAGVGVIAGSAVLGAAALAVRAADHTAEDQPVPAVEAAPTTAAVSFVAASQAPDVAPPAATWTPNEALAAARMQAGAEIAVGNYGNDLAQPPDLDAFTMTHLEWHPAITSFDLPGGDIFWKDRQGTTHNLWRVRWEAKALPTRSNAGFPLGDVVVDVLLTDGATVKGIEAIRLSVIDPATGVDRLGSSNGFESRQQDAQVRRFTEATGPLVRLAWANGVEGSRSLEAHPTAAGTWCYTLNDGGKMCSFRPEAPSPAVNYSWGTKSSPTDGLSYTLIIQTSTDVALLRAETADGQVVEVVPEEPPAEVPRGSKFALVQFDDPSGTPVVIGYDTAGNEVIRRTIPGIDPPPGAGPAPTPPRP